MAAILLTGDDIRITPQPVREWLRNHGWQEGSDPPGKEALLPDDPPTAFTPGQAELALQRLGMDYGAIQIFFDLGRVGRPTGHDDLSALSVADLMQHSGLTFETVVLCLDRITDSFRAVSGDPAASLFVVNQLGTIHIHEKTSQSIAWLWRQLAERAWADATAPQSDAPESTDGRWRNRGDPDPTGDGRAKE